MTWLIYSYRSALYFILKYAQITFANSIRDPRSGAHDIEITNNYDGTYTAKGQETESTIKPYFNKITCTCSDWSNLAIALDTDLVACEHVYAYLRFIGFDSIYDYILEIKHHQKGQGDLDAIS